MLASEAITNLRQTELKQLAVASVTDAAVLVYLNEAILELHKRFNLWQDGAIVTHATDVTLYKLDGIDVNVSIDLSDKQLLLITDVIDYEGSEISINDEDDQYGAVTPKYNQLEFPSDGLAVGEDFGVIFRAGPLSMVADTETIDLPPTLFEAMYFYVGFRAHVSQKGNKELENQTHFARFIDACNRVEAQGLIVAESTVAHKFNGLTYPWP
jgi:hypothetical protein